MTGEPWWLEPAHSWLGRAEQERADSDVVARLGRGDLLVSLSGGADSSATYLHLLESGLLEAWEQAGGRVVRAFMDTGWELPETYRYIDELERRWGKVHRLATWIPGPGEAPVAGYDHLEPLWATPGKVMDADRWALARVFEARLGHYSPMVRAILQWGKVPTSARRWCTADLKARPVQGFLRTLDDPVNAIGVRAEESRKRARFPAWEWSDDYDCWVYRPIKWWTKADRIAIHQRHGLAPNPLYLQGAGAGRVGCAPCVNSGKDDVRWLAAHHRWMLDILADLEAALAGLDTPRERKARESGVFGEHPKWFTLSVGGERRMVPVETAIAWARTAPGGRQLVLFREPEDQGCSAWGLCEAAHR